MKYLKNKTEFRGWGATAAVLMKDRELTKIKAKSLAESLIRVFMLSEDYDSDSDSSDSEDSDVEKKPTKKELINKLKKAKQLEEDGKYFLLK